MNRKQRFYEFDTVYSGKPTVTEVKLQFRKFENRIQQLVDHSRHALSKGSILLLIYDQNLQNISELYSVIDEVKKRVQEIENREIEIATEGIKNCNARKSF